MTCAAGRRHGSQRHIFCCLLAAIWLCCLALTATAAGAQGVPTAMGFSDTARYDADKDLIVVQGWLHEAGQAADATAFSVTLDGQPARVLDAQRIQRPEVAQALDLPPATPLGFVLEVAYPRYATSAPQPVTVHATLEGGQVMPVPPSTGGSPLQVTGRGTPLRHFVFAALLLPAIAGLAWRRRWPGRVPRVDAQTVCLASGAVFVALVGLGITGSSLGALIGTDQHPSPLVDAASAMQKIAGSPRSIRSDEWLVWGGSALAQVNHEPPFPVVNRLLGLDGQNMMVIGMTGVPVAHVSSLAKPATWGFFILPLRQAMAWHWYLPFFACLVALWCLLQNFAGQRPVRNLGLALVFCTAPYAAGWSHWPLYLSAWAMGALALALHMLREPPRAFMRSALQGLALGWLLACFALTLYPPWQIPLATLGLLMFGVRAVAAWRLPQRPWAAVAGYAVAAVVCGGLLLTWWAAARDAVAALQATVYPGQRAALHGGELPLAALLRGYGNLDTLAHLRYSVLNASEFASYFFLFLPMGWLALRQLRDGRSASVAALLAFAAFAVVYAVVGVPPLLAQAIFWDRVPGPRLDLVLGLVSVVLMALVPAPGSPEGQRLFTGRRTAAVAALVSAVVVCATLHAIPADFQPHLSLTLLLTLSGCAAAMAYWWMRGRTGAAIALQLLLNLLAVATFHPLGRAPSEMAPSAQTRQYAWDATTGTPYRVLALDRSTATSMALAAVGVPVVGGTFYYPQPTLWNAAHLPPPSWATVNRYQHLAFVTDAAPRSVPYTISAPAPDGVLVTVDPSRFDFSRTGAQRVVAGREADELGHNPTLHQLGRSGGFTWFAVHPPAAASLDPH